MNNGHVVCGLKLCEYNIKPCIRVQYSNTKNVLGSGPDEKTSVRNGSGHRSGWEIVIFKSSESNDTSLRSKIRFYFLVRFL